MGNRNPNYLLDLSLLYMLYWQQQGCKVSPSAAGENGAAEGAQGLMVDPTARCTYNKAKRHSSLLLLS